MVASMHRSGRFSRFLVPVAVLTTSGCASGSGPVVAAAPRDCPAPVSQDQPSRFGSVFIDERPVARNVPVRRTNEFPETYELTDPEPPELAALPVTRIDLVQYLRGPEAEATYQLCPGTVAVRFVTKPANGP